MEFSDKAKELLRFMGWESGRDVTLEELKLPYNDYPSFAIEFLKEYGNLRGNCEKQSYTNVVNEIVLFPQLSKNFLNGDNEYPYYSSVIGRKLFPLGAYVPDGYYICCDSDGRVYKIGEYCYYVGKNIYEGVENILLMNTLSSYQLDQDTGKWWNIRGEYEDLPSL
ncbi:MAG: SUKH-3 domain-containing protein [Chitinophagales bacterium]